MAKLLNPMDVSVNLRDVFCFLILTKEIHGHVFTQNPASQQTVLHPLFKWKDIAEIRHIHNHTFIEDPPVSDGGAC